MALQGKGDRQERQPPPQGQSHAHRPDFLQEEEARQERRRELQDIQGGGASSQKAEKPPVQGGIRLPEALHLPEAAAYPADSQEDLDAEAYEKHTSQHPTQTGRRFLHISHGLPRGPDPYL